MTTCSACHAEVVFVPSAKTGKAMILDAKPKKGVVIEQVILGSGPGDPRRAKVVDVYTDHHATCPNVDEFRKERVRV